MHFPSEVLEAFDILIPGAFKADLFRYCVLFIYGGVYADVDMLLKTKLDMAIDDDIGFMVPSDSVSYSERCSLFHLRQKFANESSLGL